MPTPDHRHPDLGSLGFLIHEDRRDRRGLHAGLAVAACLHAVAFVVTWPTLAGEARAVEQAPIRVLELQDFVFEPPPPVEFALPEIPPVRVIYTPEDDDEPEVYERPLDTQAPVEWNASIAYGGIVDIPDPPPDVRDTVRAYVDVEPPEVLHRVLPQYPEAARRVHLQGTVVLEFLIGPDGSVRDLTVLRGLSLGCTEAAVEAARQWRFEPSTLNGRPVSVRYVLTIRFTLQ